MCLQYIQNYFLWYYDLLYFVIVPIIQVLPFKKNQAARIYSSSAATNFAAVITSPASHNGLRTTNGT
jgi:hypothetical protein